MDFVPHLLHWNCVSKGSLPGRYGQNECLQWPNTVSLFISAYGCCFKTDLKKCQHDLIPPIVNHLIAPLIFLFFSSSFFFLLFLFCFLIHLPASFVPLPGPFPVFLCPFSLPVTPFYHHSFFLQPRLSVSCLGRIESERKALLPPTTPSCSRFLLIWYEWFSWEKQAHFTPPLSFLSCEFLSSPCSRSPHIPGKSESIIYCSSSRKTCFSLLIKPPRQSL